jgi:hypothetical protein
MKEGRKGGIGERKKRNYERKEGRKEYRET